MWGISATDRELVGRNLLLAVVLTCRWLAGWLARSDIGCRLWPVTRIEPLAADPVAFGAAAAAVAAAVARCCQSGDMAKRPLSRSELALPTEDHGGDDHKYGGDKYATTPTFLLQCSLSVHFAGTNNPAER